MARFLALAACAALGASCTPHPNLRYDLPSVCAEHLSFPAAHWCAVESPQAAGYSPAGIEAARTWLKGLSTTSAVVVVGGRVLLEYGDATELSYLASARKSVLAVLYGNYVADGTIDLDETLASLGIDDVGGLTDAEKQATVDDLMTARSGVYHAAANGGDDQSEAPARGSQVHGTYFLYNNWDFNALGTIFEKKTGKGIYPAIESDLAVPIGMEDFRLSAQHKSRDASRSIHPAYHLWLSARDMARLGLLMLHRGDWSGKQVVPADWVDTITRVVTPTANMDQTKRKHRNLAYGHLWWILEEPAGSPLEGAYTAHGMYGQFITVIPKLDMVVAHKRRPGVGRDVTVGEFHQFLELLVAAHDGAPP